MGGEMRRMGGGMRREGGGRRRVNEGRKWEEEREYIYSEGLPEMTVSTAYTRMYNTVRVLPPLPSFPPSSSLFYPPFPSLTSPSLILSSP